MIDRPVSPFRVALATLLCVVAVPAMAAIHVGLDHNGDNIVRLPGDGQIERIPIDRSSREQPFIFWLNTDQDDLDYYETWPLNRADYETTGIDSLRDLEDFTRLVVRFDDREAWRAADRLRLVVDGAEGALAVNLYRMADSECSTRYVRDRAFGETQRQSPWNDTVFPLAAGEPLEIELQRALLQDADLGGHGLCFLLEGRHEGLGTIRAELLDGGAVVDRSEPQWLSIRHIKRLYQRVNVPWPQDRPDLFDWTVPPPEPDLDWAWDPQGFPYEPAWYETDDVIVWVYGWLKSAPGLYEMSTVHSGETIFKRLWHRGYRGRLVFFHWPTMKQKLALGLGRSEYRGYKTGPVLMDHVHSYPDHKRVHVTAHSLGGVPLASAIAAGMEAETALFQASAVPAEMFDTREVLVLPDMVDVETPSDPSSGGYRGYVADTRTRIYSFYNTTDITFFGWNIAQKDVKMSAPWFKHYKHQRGAPEGEEYTFKTGLFGERAVTDPDEIRAMITKSRTHPIGAEPRVLGVVHESYDLDRPPYNFGAGHVVAWAWNPHQTTPFYNLLLDLFNIRYNSEDL